MAAEQDQESRAARALRQLTEISGREVLRDIPAVEDALSSAGVSEEELRRIRRFLRDSSLNWYLDQAQEGLSAVDLNNILRTAVSSGMTLQEAGETLNTILQGLEIPRTLELPSPAEPEEEPMEPAVPEEEWREDLDQLELKLSQDLDLTGEELDLLADCADAGVPRAFFLTGILYRTGNGVPADLEKSTAWLRRAVQGGYVPACSLLGDCFWEKREYEKAGECYTMPGAPAPGPERARRVEQLYQSGKFIRRQALLCGGALVLLDAVFLGLALLLGTGFSVLVILSALLQGCAAVLTVLTLKRYPLKDRRTWGLLPGTLLFTVSTALLLVSA